MPRSQDLTDTTSQTSFPIARPNNSHVTFTFDTDTSRPGLTQITVPKGSTWAPGPHWHESYVEYLLIVRGRVNVVIDGVTKTVTREDGLQTVQKFAIHDWMRADRNSTVKDEEDVVVEEWTDPSDGSKQVFFRNLLGVFRDMKGYWRSWMVPQLFYTSAVYDNYAVLVPFSVAPWWLNYGVTHAVFGFFGLVARSMGFRPWYEAYTPVSLRAIAMELAGGDVKAKKL